MNTLQITNLLYKTFVENDFETNIDLSVEESSEAESSVQVQINVKVPKYETLTFFYALTDENINYSVIYQVNDLKAKEEAFKIFKEEQGVFKEIIACDDNELEIHLFTQIPVKEFTVDHVYEIVRYIKDDHKLIDFLSQQGM